LAEHDGLSEILLVGLMVEVVVKRNGGRAMVYVLDEKENVYGGRPGKDILSFDWEDWAAIQEGLTII